MRSILLAMVYLCLVQAMDKEKALGQARAGALITHEMFSRAVIKLLAEMREFKITHIKDLVSRVPSESLQTYLIFTKVCHLRDIETAEQLKTITLDQRMLLAADFCDAMRSATYEH